MNEVRFSGTDGVGYGWMAAELACERSKKREEGERIRIVKKVILKTERHVHTKSIFWNGSKW